MNLVYFVVVLSSLVFSAEIKTSVVSYSDLHYLNDVSCDLDTGTCLPSYEVESGNRDEYDIEYTRAGLLCMGCGEVQFVNISPPAYVTTKIESINDLTDSTILADTTIFQMQTYFEWVIQVPSTAIVFKTNKNNWTICTSDTVEVSGSDYRGYSAFGTVKCVTQDDGTFNFSSSNNFSSLRLDVPSSILDVNSENNFDSKIILYDAGGNRINKREDRYQRLFIKSEKK